MATKAQFKLNGTQYDFEKDAAAVLYNGGKLNTALDKLKGLHISDFGKKLLAADESEFKRLLNITTETFWDEGQNRWATSNGAFTSTAQKKFGTKSLRCTSEKSVFSSDYIEFGGDPFTINFWLRTDSSIASGAWIFRAIGTKRSFGLKMKDTTTLQLYYGTTSASTEVTVTGYYRPLSQATWRHVEIDYKSGTVYFFVGGDNLYGGVARSTSLTVAREARRISFGPAACYIDEFRLVDGRCVHTANFTAPSAAYNKTADTKALLHFED